MNTLLKKGEKVIVDLSRRGHAAFASFVNCHATTILFVMGLTLITLGLTEMGWAQNQREDVIPGYDPTPIRQSVALLFQLIEGSFGALIMVVAGIGAIIAAAFGAYRAAVGMLVVAVGAFILRALVSLFFGTFEPGLESQTTPGSPIQ